MTKLNYFQPHPECYIISPEKSCKSRDVNSLRIDTMRAVLESDGYPFKSLEGCYKGLTEKSFLICDISEAEALRLAIHYGQESILYLDADRSAFLIFADGSETQALGEFKSVPRALAKNHDSWTVDPANPNEIYICDGASIRNVPDSGYRFVGQPS